MTINQNYSNSCDHL